MAATSHRLDTVVSLIDKESRLGRSSLRVDSHRISDENLELRLTPFSDPQDMQDGPVIFPSLSDLILQTFANKGHRGKGRTFGHGRLKHLQHRHRRRVVGPD